MMTVVKPGRGWLLRSHHVRGCLHQEYRNGSWWDHLPRPAGQQLRAHRLAASRWRVACEGVRLSPDREVGLVALGATPARPRRRWTHRAPGTEAIGHAPTFRQG